MRYWYLLIVSFLLVACQPTQPSEIEQYNTAKTKANQHLESEFKRSIDQQITDQSNQVIDASDFVVSQKVVQDLENVLTSLDKPVETEADNDTIPVVDSITKISKTSLVEQKPSNGAMLLNVRNYQETYDKVRALSKKHDLNIVNELEQTGNFHKGNTMEIQMTPENFETVLDEFRNLAVVIRQKQVWEQKEKKGYLPIVSRITTTKKHLVSLNTALEKSTVLEDQLKLRDKISDVYQELNLATLSATNILSNQSYSTLTLAFYQNLEMAKPKVETFSAGFSSNLVIGWAGFKQFVLDAALVWPYIIIGFMLLLTVLLAVGTSRKRTRQFKLQMLHGQTSQQQQQLVQPISPNSASKN
ncbi:MAG: DUF4349 domain-containing protein [Aureispira sp.]|nr:DUF4349 domain-containing protein [Aureispira sp.]